MAWLSSWRRLRTSAHRWSSSIWVIRSLRARLGMSRPQVWPRVVAQATKARACLRGGGHPPRGWCAGRAGLEFAENLRAAAAGQVEVEHGQGRAGHASEVTGAAQEP